MCVCVIPSTTDPLSMSPQKALETIGANLQKQYENWQPRVSVHVKRPPSDRNAVQTSKILVHMENPVLQSLFHHLSSHSDSSIHSDRSCLFICDSFNRLWEESSFTDECCLNGECSSSRQDTNTLLTHRTSVFSPRGSVREREGNKHLG